ncbi:ganglioside GM2 activator-like [Acanthaster planci]|uniref:Ganglioside GM2 activator-like n=1 Tax=Acanthaster planci TaxID=133434 RepID=A0A8B7YR62_ACAPL|nr:ganglioside GM2 activator-like [Acanthaster planci]
MKPILVTIILVALCLIFGSEGSYFSWKQCSSTADTALQVGDLSFAPDPIKLNDHVTVDLGSEVTRNVTYPLTLTLTINKVMFWGWKMRIPCLSLLSGGLPIGSCEYDVCSAMEHLETTYGCPSEFKSNGLPCRCPFASAGSSYNTASTEPVRLFLDTTSLPSIMTPFLNGRYHIIAEITDGNSNKVMCVEYKIQIG